MPDQLGNITVPTVSPSGTFPFVSDYPSRMQRDWRLVVHEMDNRTANLKIQQRYLIGTGARLFTFFRETISLSQRDTLLSFFEARQGGYQPFTYQVPNDNRTSFTAYTVRFRNEPLVFELGDSAAFRVECTFVEVPSSFPSYSVSSTVTRFPSSGLTTQLLQQEQEIVPLLHIKVRDSSVPDNIFLSDRRCTVGGQIYQARLLNWSEISQSIGSEADQAKFTFGNADRVLRDLAADTDLYAADVEFSLYHVGTGIKLNLWKGYVETFEGAESTEFALTASDGLPLNALYPPRQVDRLCWKEYNDGVNCPASSAGGTNLSTPCDKGLDTPAGCRFHNMIRYHGAIQVKPQGVLIKDNSTGTWGIGRNIVNATSLVADSIYGQPLQEVYCDQPMPVNALIAAARDEGDFYDGLGIISAGPIASVSQNIFSHKLNGLPPHGPGILGFRASIGPDPDLQTSGIFPADNDHYFQLTETSGPPAGGSEIFAAGVAFAEIRIRDEKGIQPRAVTEAQMQVMVTGGMGGWYWDSGGARSYGAPMVSPVWVAVNAYLRSKALQNASSAAQLAAIDYVSAEANSAICADLVNKLVGSGVETQFRFRGVLADKRPLRDYLDEMLKVCLGYYTFQFGKLKIGIRINASAVESYTEGNILRDSVRLVPSPPKFNVLSVEFGDEEYEYVKNTFTLQDEVHVKRYGARAGTLSLVACATKSQAARVALVRLREELGGISSAEWAKKRHGTWAVPLLGLASEPGQVVSLTHPDAPGGSAKFRVQKWTLRKDYSILLEVETVTNSMYDPTVGPKPVDVSADPVPVERIEEAIPTQPWFPNKEQPAAGDPLFDVTDWRFGLAQNYSAAADATALAQVTLTGEYPVTDTLDADPPRMGSSSTAATGGAIAGGSYVAVVLVATDPSGKPTRASKGIGVQVPSGTNTNTITIAGITWPAEAAGGGYRLYASLDRAQLSEQATGGSQPSSITLASIANIRTRGIPVENIAGLIPRAKQCHHVGINKYALTAVATGALTVAGAGWTVNQFAGRVASILADVSDGSAPLWNFSISSNTADTLSVSPDPNAAGVEVDDILAVLTKADSFSASTIGDSLLQNPQHLTGLPVNGEKGRVIRIVAGTGIYQEKLIASNSATVLTIVGTWETVPDASSIFVLEDASWQYVSEVIQLTNSAEGGDLSIALPLENLLGRTITVEVAAIDRQGRESARYVNPWRWIYMLGDGGTIATVDNEGYIEIPGAAAIVPDIANGITQEITLDRASTTVDLPIYTGGTLAAGQRMDIIFFRDGSTSNRLVTFNSDYLLPSGFELGQQPDTQTTIAFRLQPDGKWVCRHFMTNLPQ